MAMDNPEIDMTPMIDCVFQLITFFMLVINFESTQADERVKLPESEIAKPPKVGKATPWHEDSSYWDGRVSTMAGIVTIWLALDRATKENGCMAVIPGTHDNGFSHYKPVDASKNIFSSEIVAESVLGWLPGKFP